MSLGRRVLLIGLIAAGLVVVFIIAYTIFVGLRPSGSPTQAISLSSSAQRSRTPAAVASPSPPPSPTIAPTPTAVPTPTPVTYTVQSGDTYIGIAQRFNTTLDRLLQINNRTVNTPLRPKDVLVIP